MTKFKSAFFFITGLFILMCVVGGIESLDLTFVQSLQMVLLTLAGIGLMLVGSSYADELVDKDQD